MGSNRICKMCFTNFARKTSEYSDFCSSECRSKLVNRKKCTNGCDEADMMVVPVNFVTGDIHYKKVCKKCRNGRYVNRQLGRSFVQNVSGTELEQLERKVKARYGESFYSSKGWLRLRYQTLIDKGHQCAVCGSTDKPMHVDHIKPRSKFPQLALEKSNLQVLCKQCNLGKGADY